jgi:hypothetical protein
MGLTETCTTIIKTRYGVVFAKIFTKIFVKALV